jgi:hypothetical protein
MTTQVKMNKDELDEAIMILLTKIQHYVTDYEKDLKRKSYWFDVSSEGTKLINLLRNLYQAYPSDHSRNNLILDIIELIIFPGYYSMSIDKEKIIDHPMFFSVEPTRNGDSIKIPAFNQYNYFRTALAHTCGYIPLRGNFTRVRSADPIIELIRLTSSITGVTLSVVINTGIKYVIKPLILSDEKSYDLLKKYIEE